MSFVLGLTGSIGMGKSTTARMFADHGLPVWDADATVHRLYAPGQPAALAIGTLFPTAIDPDGSVNRARLRALIQADPTVFDRLNAAVHPLVAADRAAFLMAHDAAPIVLLDVPLLYEISLDHTCDAIAVDMRSAVCFARAWAISWPITWAISSSVRLSCWMMPV